VVALSGLAARAFVIGTAPHGTSARGTRRPTADSLSTQGAYSIVRHPLYVANTLVALGCALLSGTWYLPLIVVLLSFIYHERIAAREEAFLQTTFGDRFKAWASEVPAMIPAFGRYQRSDVPFRTRRVIVQESHGLCAIGTAFLALDTIEGIDAHGIVPSRPAMAGDFPGVARPAPRRGDCEKIRMAGGTDMMTTAMATTRVRLGSEQLLASGMLKNKRVGIVSNPASIDAKFQHIVRVLAETPEGRAGRDLRSPAWISSGCAGQHDRDGPRQRPVSRRAGVFALQ
jgi:hypothetical protein